MIKIIIKVIIKTSIEKYEFSNKLLYERWIVIQYLSRIKYDSFTYKV